MEEKRGRMLNPRRYDSEKEYVRKPQGMRRRRRETIVADFSMSVCSSVTTRLSNRFARPSVTTPPILFNKLPFKYIVF
ncbi:hypothetical protein Hanom_Chr12g01097121 [Helianthus anomalus]